MANSIDIVAGEARIERDAQLRHFESLDTKAGVTIGFAGLLVTFSREASAMSIARSCYNPGKERAMNDDKNPPEPPESDEELPPFEFDPRILAYLEEPQGSAREEFERLKPFRKFIRRAFGF